MTKNKPVNKEVILERINIIQKTTNRLKEMQKLSVGEFAIDDNFAIIEHNLRYALEAVFDICGHILARIPGVEADEYKKMAKEMGNQKIIPVDFANKKLLEMAGYRNRLTHLYFEITGQEMYNIINKDLGDFDDFNKFIKNYLEF